MPKEFRTNDRTVAVLLALGANLGEPGAQIEAAVGQLRRVMTIDAVSDIYRTEPVGGPAQPEYLNLVVAGHTHLPIYELHTETRRIEEEHGRVPAPRNEPRTLDIDILTYGELALVSADLEIPHPRMMERTFVLVPLVEVAPEWRHPVSGQTARAGLEGVRNVSRVSRQGSLEAAHP